MVQPTHSINLNTRKISKGRSPPPADFTAPASKRQRWKLFGVCSSIALTVWLVFGQTLQHDFVNYDDDQYVYQNPKVLSDVTPDGIGWLLTHYECNFYHPLTMISLNLDHHLYGLKPGGYHLTNVLIHMFSAIFLFLVLHRMTAALWRSALVALLFAIHPLNVESVAWITERKELLGGFFFILTLAAYVHYVRSKKFVRYLCMIVLFSLGLMSKPSVVTLPFVLLLLDFWPLQRFQAFTLGDVRPLVLEKIPLFVLSAAASVLAIFAQGEGIIETKSLSVSVRATNALLSYVTYLGQIIFPTGLTPFYPHPGIIPALWKPIAAATLLACILLAAVIWRKKHPFILTGWLWFMGMLVPMIGIVQVGSLYAHADRFMYLPQIGLYLLAIWTVAELTSRWRGHTSSMIAGAVMVVGILMVCSREQTSHWKNSEALWRHALTCTTNNSVARNNLGFALLQRGEAGEAEEAITQFEEAVKIEPYDSKPYEGLGIALYYMGQLEEAIIQFQKSVEIDPDYVQGHYHLGLALLKAGRMSEAATHFEQTLKIRPDHVQANNSLGWVLLQVGQTERAIASFTKAVAIQPDFLPANINLAWTLATCPETSLRNGRKAIGLAEQARVILGHDNPDIEKTLAAAYAENGNFTQAIESAQRALELAAAQSATESVEELQTQIKSYQAGLPFRTTHQTNSTVYP